MSERRFTEPKTGRSPLFPASIEQERRQAAMYEAGRASSEYVTVRRDDLEAALADVEHMQDEYGPCGNPTEWIDRLRAALAEDSHPDDPAGGTS